MNNVIPFPGNQHKNTDPSPETAQAVGYSFALAKQEVDRALAAAQAGQDRALVHEAVVRAIEHLRSGELRYGFDAIDTPTVNDLSSGEAR